MSAPNQQDIQFWSQLASWLDQCRPMALITVVETWGSSPRPVGSQMLVTEQGDFAGSVSGGCIEGQLISEALLVIATGIPQQLSFGVSDEEAQSQGLLCGGRIKLAVQPVDQSLAQALTKMLVAREQRREVFIDSPLESAGESRCELEPEQALGDDRPVSVRDGRLWVHFRVPERLFVIGAGHIAQLLVPMAQTIGCQVTVVDPRRVFLSEQRFPTVERWCCKPEDIEWQLDRHSALVALSHDPSFDDPALMAALNSEAFYIGALGSRQSHRARLERLQAAGFDDAEHRIQGPIGLNLGGRSAGEIALSIAAQLQQFRYRKP